MRRRAAQIGSFVGFALLLTTPQTATAADHSVSATTNNTFVPATVTVSQGDSVTWANGGGFHNVHFDDESFVQPPTISPDAWTFSRTFDQTGSFRYYCDAHGASGGLGMAGTVNVTATAADPAGTGGSGSAGAPLAGQGVASTCASKRRFRIRLRGLDGVRVRSARVSFNRTQVAVRTQLIDGRHRHTALIDLRGLPRGAYTIEIAVTTATGRVLRGTRTYRTCAGKLTSDKLPRL